jgi:tetratricopeptide (TPR) repeat protein
MARPLEWIAHSLRFFVAAATFAATQTVAHAPLEEQVESVSAQILDQPRSAEHYLARAELHRRLGDVERAAADYDRALLLAPDLAAVWLGRARLFLASGEAERALDAADRYLAAADDPSGWTARARALVALGRPDDAAADLARAIERDPEPDPTLFLERARLLAEAGPAGVVAALAALDEGQARLGVLASLQWPAIEWELALGRPDAALARLDALSPWYERPESWLAARGDVLLRAGRVLEAQAAYTDAWEALDSRPLSGRDSPAARRLRQRLADAMRAPGEAR